MARPVDEWSRKEAGLRSGTYGVDPRAVGTAPLRTRDATVMGPRIVFMIESLPTRPGEVRNDLHTL